jgi:tetratricopeptide (TPR) repeat protein
MLQRLIHHRRYRKAMASLQDGQIDRAVEILETLRQSKTHAPHVHLWLGWVKLARGDWGEALRELDRAETLGSAAELGPTFSAPLHLWRANAHRGRREFVPALEHARQAVALVDDIETRWTLAVMKKHNSLLDEAIADLRGIVDCDDPQWRQHATQSLAGYLFLAGETETARAVHATIARPQGGTALGNFLVNEAWICACRNDLEACASAIQQAWHELDHAFLRSYLALEVEFDRFREEPRFREVASGPR